MRANAKIDKAREIVDALRAVLDAHDERDALLKELFATGDAYGPGKETPKWVAENWVRIRGVVMPDFNDSE